MTKETREAHVGLGHFCAGCPLNDKWHAGCIVNGDAKVVEPKEEKQTRQSISPQLEVDAVSD